MPLCLRVPGQNLGQPCFMKPGVSFLMGKLLWNKRVCVCVCVCVGVGTQGKREKRREEGKNKQPNSKDMWFSSCGLMQGLRGLSEDRSPDCGRAKDWVGLGRVLRTKSLLRKLYPGRGRQQEGGHLQLTWEPAWHRLLVYPRSHHSLTHTGAPLPLRQQLSDAVLYKRSFQACEPGLGVPKTKSPWRKT